jgi:hypothetical protein
VLATNPNNPDTDGDLIPDHWEVINALNPSDPDDAILDNDTNGPDGLTNLDEYRFNTDPQKNDTDGDGTSDSDEANGPDGNPDTDDGSNPNDASDNGQRPPADQLVTFKLGVGDRSGSHSEDYVLNVFLINPITGEEDRIYTLRSGGFGQYKQIFKSFAKGSTYTFQIDWQGTKINPNNSNAGDPDYPPSPGGILSSSASIVSYNATLADFDYHMVVEPQGTTHGGILIDSYDPQTKTASTNAPILDPFDVNAASDNDDNVANFVTTIEKKRVLFLTAPITSRDRLIEGEMTIFKHLFSSFDLSFTTVAENLGSYSFGPGSTSGYIFSSLDEIFSDSELAMVNSATPDTNDHRIADQTVFYRDAQQPIKIKWFTALNNISSFKVTLTQNGTALGELNHTPTPENNFSGLMDHLAKRIKTSNMPALPTLVEPTTEVGYAEEDGETPPAAQPTPPPVPPVPAVETIPIMTGIPRNLWAKVCFMSNVAWELTKEEAVRELKVGGGFIKGLTDGLVDGFESDAKGIAELGLMIGESVQGNHARAKQFWDGIKMMANMTAPERKVMFENMRLTFVEKAQAEVPWDSSASSFTDDWGEAAYMSGYLGGFLSEQVIMIYVTAGVGKGLMWLGNGVKNAIMATRAGVVAGQIISAAQKFLVGAYLSVTKFIVGLGEEGIRMAQSIFRQLSTKTYLGLMAAEMTHEVMMRLGALKMTYQLIATMVAPYCTTVADWLHYGYSFYKRMCQICTIVRVTLNESAIKGFGRLYPALKSPTSLTADYAEHLLNVCRNTPTSPVDGASLNAVLELFDDAKLGFKLTRDPANITRWTSPAGIVYEQGSNEGHRISHLLAHTVDGYIEPGKLLAKPNHSLFNVTRSQLFELLDEAWLRPHLPAYKLSNPAILDTQAFIVDTGRIIGMANSNY